MNLGIMIRTKWNKRTRRKKPECSLKTKYYYREGRLSVEPVDNSSLGLYLNVYVFIKKYSKERDQFLIEYIDGELTWTDQVVPVCPTIDDHELYYTCFELLAQRDYRPGQQVCFRTQDGFAFLKKENQACCLDYSIFANGLLNLNNVPKSFNYALGYSDNEALPTFDNIVLENKTV